MTVGSAPHGCPSLGLTPERVAVDSGPSSGNPGAQPRRHQTLPYGVVQAQKVDGDGGSPAGCLQKSWPGGHHVPQQVPGVSSRSQATGPWRLEAAHLRPAWGVWGEDPRSADPTASPAFCSLTWETAPRPPAGRALTPPRTGSPGQRGPQVKPEAPSSTGPGKVRTRSGRRTRGASSLHTHLGRSVEKGPVPLAKGVWSLSWRRDCFFMGPCPGRFQFAYLETTEKAINSNLIASMLRIMFTSPADRFTGRRGTRPLTQSEHQSPGDWPRAHFGNLGARGRRSVGT